ncbi:MAG: HEAT repeat domain-containing protein [Rivularia sp. (in: Bacteria)]|nr:HEAT repeat domain-containing protein [Rivularia sp. MS3]
MTQKPIINQVEGIFLVLPDHIGREYFVNVMEQLNWFVQQIHEGDGIKKAYQEIWTTEDRANAINYVEDPLTMTHFLWLRGSNIHDLLPEIWGRIPAYESEELLEMAVEAEEHDDAVRAVLRIAVGFPNFDSDALSIFEQYLTSTSPLLRKATIQAIAYRLWTETAPLLEKVSQEDSDEDVKSFAQNILCHLRNS